MAAIQGVEFVLTGDPARAKSTAAAALEARKFKVAWSDEWTATAERGNKVANVLLGAIAQYFKVGLRVMSAPDGNAIVRLERQSSGWMGGAIGAKRTTTNLQRLRDELTSVFTDAGVLVAARDL